MEQYTSTVVKHNMDQPQGHNAERSKIQKNAYCMIVYVHFISCINLCQKKKNPEQLLPLGAEVGE